MTVVVLDLGVVAADHTGGAPDLPGHDGVDERLRRSTQRTHHCFHREARHQIHRRHRDVHLIWIAQSVVLHGHLHKSPRRIHRGLGMELVVIHLWEVGLVGGGDHLGVIALSHLAESGHNALIIDDHHLHGARGQHQLAHEVIAGHGDAVTHDQLIARAAQPCQIDAGGTHRLGELHHLRQLHRIHYGLGDQRIVAVHQDVDVVLFEHTHVDGTGHRLRDAEEDVGYLSGDHGAAPAVGERVARPVHNETVPAVVHTHVGAVHHLRGLAVNTAWCHTQLGPQLPAFRWRARSQLHFFLASAEVLHHGVGDFPSQSQIILAVHHDAVLCCYGPQFLGRTHRVALRFARSHLVQDLHQVTAVVGVRRRPGRDHTTQVAGHDDVGVGSANATLRPLTERIDATGTHSTDAAAQPHLTVAALRLLRLMAVPDGFHSVALGFGQQELAVFRDGVLLELLGIDHVNAPLSGC
ncbi:MAG: hypothetical protein BWY79_01448 [Actinobacteria bacterium ADurb.Bin444]|nr:MAG: hypothetical protein BWY79_01448 [Actinobacteria bacterium ADurb.Bin444]